MGGASLSLSPSAANVTVVDVEDQVERPILESKLPTKASV